MTLTRKDGAATVLAALVVLVYFANSNDWALSSNRWAAGVIGVLGIVGCSLGRPADRRSDVFTVLLSLLGLATLALLVLALWRGSQETLGLLALTTVALWAGSTLRHLGTRPVHRPLHGA